jgi:putative membrane protein
MKFIIRLLIKIATVIALAYVLPKVAPFLSIIHVETTLDAVKVALLISILNVTVRPILQLLALPITCLTLGLFSLVISAAMVVLADYLIDGFTTGGWLPALVFSISFSFVSSLVEKFIED